MGLIKDTQKSIDKLYSLAKGQKDKTRMVDKYKEDFDRFVQSFHQLNSSSMLERNSLVVHFFFLTFFSKSKIRNFW